MLKWTYKLKFCSNEVYKNPSLQKVVESCFVNKTGKCMMIDFPCNSVLMTSFTKQSVLYVSKLAPVFPFVHVLLKTACLYSVKLMSCTPECPVGVWSTSQVSYELAKDILNYSVYLLLPHKICRSLGIFNLSITLTQNYNQKPPLSR